MRGSDVLKFNILSYLMVDMIIQGRWRCGLE